MVLVKKKSLKLNRKQIFNLKNQQSQKRSLKRPLNTENPQQR